MPYVNKAGHEKKLRSLKKGEWLNSPDCVITNDIQDLLSPHFNFDMKSPLPFILAVLIIKIKIVSDLEDNAFKLSKLVEKMEQADPQSISGQFRSNMVLMESIELFAIGNPKKHKLKLRDQKVQMKSLMVALHKRNPTLLPALVNPKPLLDLGIHEGGKAMYDDKQYPGPLVEAAEILSHTWKFFKRLPAARQKLIDFLYPNHSANSPFPSYM